MIGKAVNILKINDIFHKLNQSSNEITDSMRNLSTALNEHSLSLSDFYIISTWLKKSQNSEKPF